MEARLIWAVAPKGVLMNPQVRRILELVGVLPSQQEALRRKLVLASRARPRGAVSLLLRRVGTKQSSVVSLVRNLTGLEFDEAVALLNYLPMPLLVDVSLETAVDAKNKLERLGVEVELLEPASVVPLSSPLPQSPSAPPVTRLKESQKAGFATRPGEYAVTLTAVGLLGERVLSAVQQVTGKRFADVTALEESLPLLLLHQVDEETAVRAQTLLQMVGAVVDIDQIE